MRLIDADALKEKISYRQWDVDDDLPRDEASTRISECYVIDHMVDDMPTVDAVPVIRCKDCKYYNPQQHYCEGIGNWFGYDGEWSDNGYCYKAERREE